MKKEDGQENNEDEDDDQDKQPFMYFIRSGIYSVTFDPPSKSSTDHNDTNKREPSYRELKLGDHFGEIGLIYGCKRTATVKSDNYGQLAKLNKKNLLELSKVYDGIQTMFKNEIMGYYDPNRMFLEATLSQIDYFNDLQEQSKQELIYNMNIHVVE